MSLAKSLSNDVSALHELWRQRDKLQNQKAQLQQDKDKIGDALFQTEFNQELEDDFNLLVRTLNKSQAQIDAANRKIDQAELALHAVLPLSTETFQRLFQALQIQTHELDFQNLLAQLHPQAVERFKLQTNLAKAQESQTQNLFLPTQSPSFQSISLETKLQELASLCPLSFSLRKLQIPSVPYLALQVQSPQAVSIQNGSTIIRQWTKEEIQLNRQKTMQSVIDCTNTLVDLAIQILEFSENIQDFHPPPFVLAPLPLPESPQLAAFEITDSREETLKQEIRDQLELRRQMRAAQGRGDEPLQAFELDVIGHSLSLRTYGEKFSIQQVKEMIRYLFPETQFQVQTEPLMRVVT
jgi:hypothetical protein